jgi:hypothetical protein
MLSQATAPPRTTPNSAAAAFSCNARPGLRGRRAWLAKTAWTGRRGDPESQASSIYCFSFSLAQLLRSLLAMASLSRILFYQLFFPISRTGRTRHSAGAGAQLPLVCRPQMVLVLFINFPFQRNLPSWPARQPWAPRRGWTAWTPRRAGSSRQVVAVVSESTFPLFSL